MAGEGTSYNDIDASKVLNKAGLLELSSQIKTYIDANASGGGSSYTAGNGINIDSNNVISVRQTPGFRVELLGNTTSAYNPYVVSASNMTWQQFLEALQKGIIVSTVNVNADWINRASKMLEASTVAGDAYAKFYVCNLSGATAHNFWEVSTRALGGYAYYFDGVVLYMWNKGADWTNWQEVQISNTTKKVGEVLNDLNNRIPTPSTTDGTYMLQCVVSSGTPTYSWVSVS